VAVVIGTQEFHNLDAIAANILDHVAENAERGDNLDLVTRVSWTRKAEHEECGKNQL
jgi:hypothetical protein